MHLKMLAQYSHNILVCAVVVSWCGKMDWVRGACLHRTFGRMCRCADAYSDTILGYANSIRTSDGGTHLEGMKQAITRTLNALARKSGKLKVSLAANRL
jgi:hypothetical protein